jgi:predicted ATPase
MRLSWLPKVTRGFFMRAESFFNFARYIDEEMPDVAAGLWRQVSCTNSRTESPSWRCSPTSSAARDLHPGRTGGRSVAARQLEFLKVIRLLELEGQSQFIIATHSPILMAYPRRSC